ncbi:asparaginase [Labrenzia sp. VG12]|uniref:asparaginase n=1 Tax=Labrenzia sp. VG12 TaxID=2021862 RepID=UPI000B8C68A2|nr:asparaginase [Labrenzia sp. VG12]ASP34649.1 L-asparaginase 1 [Labrenzia sp. VG12]
MRILLVHTGGTIGMAQTGAGFAPRRGVVEDAVVALQAEGKLPEEIALEVLEPLIDSANATPEDWNRIARVIHAHQHAFEGVVVTHGTDTLAYTSAALCFALEGLRIPVVLTGAMLPLTVDGNDGVRNLIEAFQLVQATAAGVWVQFAGKKLHGGRVRKSHSRAFDGFSADPSDIPPLQRAGEPNLHCVGTPAIGIIAMAPGMPASLLQHAAETCDGLVLRCFGSGTAPDTQGLRVALEIAQSRRIPVVGVSQCPEGGMALGTYAAAQILLDHDVVDGRDMTVEAAYAKLAYTLAFASDPAGRRQRLEACLCGEFTP